MKLRYRIAIEVLAWARLLWPFLLFVALAWASVIFHSFLLILAALIIGLYNLKISFEEQV